VPCPRPPKIRRSHACKSVGELPTRFALGANRTRQTPTVYATAATRDSYVATLAKAWGNYYPASPQGQTEPARLPRSTRAWLLPWACEERDGGGFSGRPGRRLGFHQAALPLEKFHAKDRRARALPLLLSAARVAWFLTGFDPGGSCHPGFGLAGGSQLGWPFGVGR